MVLLVVTGTSTEPKAPKYYEAKHGFNGGDIAQVDLSKLDGFDRIRTVDQLALFATKVPGAIGFTAHPEFETGERYADAIISYTTLSPTNESWKLYLYDKLEADKLPGSAPNPRAEMAFEARVQAKMEEARKLITSNGAMGVKLVGNHSDVLPLAYAILRLKGRFQHTGFVSADICIGCRSVVPGGNPRKCGMGLLRADHWNCCGQAKKTEHCRYWELIKGADDLRQADLQKSRKPVSGVMGPNGHGYHCAKPQ